MDGGVFLQDGGEQGTNAATDVDNGIHSGPIIRVGNLLVFVATKLGEGTIEGFILFRVLSGVFPEGLTEDMVGGGVAGHNPVAESRGGPNIVLGAVEERKVAQAARPIAKQIGYGVVREYSWRDLLKGTKCSQRSERP